MNQNDTKGLSLRLIDAHCHVGWFADPAALAREAAGMGLGFLSVTVTPEEFRALDTVLAGEKSVALAAGLHPWWVRKAADADALCELLPDVRWVGEIGLDAAPRHAATWDAQLAAFSRVCATCAETSSAEVPKVLSIHAVRCAGTVLDVLEQTGAAASCRCVLHWFSGSSEELWRAARLGCLFSLGERSLATRRGREYARILPAECLLTETDLPEDKNSPTTTDDVIGSLNRALTGIAAARNLTPAEVSTLVTRNSTQLLS